MPDPTQPFAGVRILDFTQVFAGPFASYQLALLGADVVKIERPNGDDMRRGPPNKEWAARNLGTGFLGINSNKRFLALDLTRPKAIEIARRLAARADVVMENFRPGVMDKLGIGYGELSQINPRLIYCAISGFGQNGPERATASYDGKIQAMSGIMSVTGFPETGPTRAGFAVCDAIAGMTAAFAVSSALFQRTHTGKGQLVDVAMLDATLAFLTTYVTDFTIGGHVQGQLGNKAQSRLPTADTFRCKGGHILLAVNNDKQFAALAKAIDRPGLLQDPRFVDWPARMANEKHLRAIIEEVLSADDDKTWEARLTAADVPCARVWSIPEIVAHPQLAHREVLQKVATPHGELTFVGSGFRLAHGGGRVERPAQLPGADAAAVLAEAGYSEAEIAAMRRDGVV
jgi:crotonobetainyl-CoA:carnitine CoA-transferase CaiB-like acyl-CoA transferase